MENKCLLYKGGFYVLLGYAVAYLASCATTYVQPMLEYEGTDQLEVPTFALIHDFVSPPEYDSVDRTPGSEIDEAIEMAQAANTVLYNTLAQEMIKLGLPAQRAADPIPEVRNILSIEGEFLCLDEGNRFKRLLIGFGAGAAQVNAIVRIYLQSGDQKELLQEFMATVETSDKAGIGPAVLGFDPMAGGGMIATALSCGMSAASETWTSDIEALSHTLAKIIVNSLLPLSIEHGWLGTPDDFVPPD